MLLGQLRFFSFHFFQFVVELAGKATGQQLFIMPSVGFRWFPTDSGLFVTPWAGFGVSVWNSGPGRLGDHTYEPLRFFPIAALHVGYEL